MIYADAVVKRFLEATNFTQQEKEEAKDNFAEKFQKYIIQGVKYLTNKILKTENLNTVTIVCEGIARLILTMFNQEKYSAFPAEGNSLLREMRLYQSKELAKNASSRNIQQQIQQEVFNVKSNTEIIQIINGAQKEDKVDDYDLCIRIVDNEGIKTRNVAEALRTLNLFVSNRISNHRDNKVYNDYNKKHNIITRTDGLDDDYNKLIDDNNLANVFHYHAAKHLYIVFDCKPLETQVFAPIEHGDKDIVQVYHAASGTRQAKYSIQSGNQYRELAVNRAVGYNKQAIFRSQIDSNELQDILIKKIVSHAIILLIPYIHLREGLGSNEEQGGREKIFNSFVRLVQQDYINARSCYIEETVETILNDTWIEQIKEYWKKVKGEKVFSDVSSASSSIEFDL